MLHVDLDNIVTNDELVSKAEEVLRKADDEGKIVVVTRNGRPAVAILKLEQLEELSGRTVNTTAQPVSAPAVTPMAPPAEPAQVPAMPMAQPEVAPAPMSDSPSMASQPQHTPQPEVAQPNPSGLPDMP